MRISRKEKHAIQGRISFANAHCDHEQVLLEVARLLADESAGTKALGLFYRGEVYENQGYFEQATIDWRAALEHESEGTFLRCELHHRLGTARKESGDIKGANDWFRKALQTCVTGDYFSCHSTLVMFLGNNSRTIPSVDHDLTAAALDKSWAVLEFPGKPDLEDLPGSIIRLDEMFQELLQKTIRGT